MVWSPLSNLMLYGGTTNIGAARSAGVPLALGSDWSPTGSKNLLNELKIARVDNEVGDWAVKTVNSLQWRPALGRAMSNGARS